MENTAIQKRNALDDGKNKFPAKTIDLIKNLNPKIIFEFGAFNGADTLLYRGMFPDAEIYSFEANPLSYKEAKPLLLSENIHFYNYAIADVLTEMDFYYMINRKDGDRISPAGSFYPFSDKVKNHLGGEWSFPTPIKVPCITLEWFCQKHKIEHIDYIHMDVEGGICLVLAGMGHLRPEMIFAEVVADWACLGALSLEQNNALFGAMGYTIIAGSGADADRLYKFKGN